MASIQSLTSPDDAARTCSTLEAVTSSKVFMPSDGGVSGDRGERGKGGREGREGGVKDDD